MRHNFAVFIMSYNRANQMCTIDALRKSGYTGDIYIIIGDDEPDKDRYYRNFHNEHIVEFKKEEAAKLFDLCTNEPITKTIVYARNASYKIAKDLGIDYFIQFEDDYQHFDYRYVYGGKLMYLYVKELDEVFDLMIDFMESSHADILAFAQGGDFLGGAHDSFLKNRLKRKAMNSLLCKTDNPVEFMGAMNDDVNAYITHGKRGKLFLTVADLMLFQRHTQQASGGNTEMYLEFGTYIKSFYSVMLNPNCIRVADLGSIHNRIHHSILWEKAVPKIIDEKYKKSIHN